MGGGHNLFMMETTNCTRGPLYRMCHLLVNCNGIGHRSSFDSLAHWYDGLLMTTSTQWPLSTLRYCIQCHTVLYVNVATFKLALLMNRFTNIAIQLTFCLFIAQNQVHIHHLDIYVMKHCQWMTINVRFTLSVGDTTRAVYK